jgi:site-specific recombinase XerD
MSQAESTGPGPKLLEQRRTALRSRHYSRRTEKACVMWARRFVRFHDLRHPAQLAEPEINAFLTHLAVEGHVSASTQNQALSALLFLYRHVLDRERKVYQEVPAPDAAKQDLIRVIDESGEDYLFPRELFLPVELSGEAREAILRAS